jgi:hypothetical protein
MIITIIIHNKCDDESHSQQNPMRMLITITFLIEYSHQIQFDQKLNQRRLQAFLKDRLTIEFDNSSTLILTKASHSGSINILR